MSRLLDKTAIQSTLTGEGVIMPAKPNMSWEGAIQQVLATAGGALHYTEIAERIATKGLRSSVGATPAMTVSSVLSTALKKGGSPYLRIGGGQYALHKSLSAKQDSTGADAVAEVESSDTGVLQAFGMFWRRDLIVWVGGKQRLLGRQGTGASDVDFAQQIGVYLLHDRERVIYVGRAADTLFARLKAHTSDRLAGRWDRFSWFGLKGVGENGALADPIAAWTPTIVIETMEALLIESLEPSLNRKRGDNFAAVEYIQVADPQVENARRKALLSELAKGAGLEG